VRRGRISERWWALLGRFGLTQQRWRSWPAWTRRLVKATTWLGLGLILTAAFGTWTTSALAVAAVVLLIVVPPWDRLPNIGPYRTGRWIPWLIALGFVVAYPYYVNGLPQLPVFGPFPNVHTMVVAGIFTMMALGLNFVVGYAGLLDLGYVAFYAMGAYVCGWFASEQFAGQHIDVGAVGLQQGWIGIHLSIWLVLPIAGLMTALIGVIIGLPTLRLRGDYLAIVTLGFGEIMPQVADNGNNLGGFNLTNGTGGITSIDGPGFGHGTVARALHLPASYLGAGNLDSLFFWTVIVLVLITIFCSARLRDSRLGRAWIAIREDETAAAAMGIPLMRTKTWSYATGAFFGGVAGAYYSSYNGGAFPDQFLFQISVFILCMVILGGMGSIPGVMLGAWFLAYLDQEGLSNVGGWINSHFNTNINVPNYEFGIYGLIIVVVMLLRPEGLIPSSRRAAELHEGVHDEPLYDVEELNAPLTEPTV